jgi:hypothetical protein
MPFGHRQSAAALKLIPSWAGTTDSIGLDGDTTGRVVDKNASCVAIGDATGRVVDKDASCIGKQRRK